MEIKQSLEDGLLKITIEGDLDASSAILMDQTIKKSLKNGNYNILIDSANLNYISSAGLGAFISNLEDIKNKNGLLAFYNMSENVYNTVHVLGLDKIIQIVNNEEDAISIMIPTGTPEYSEALGGITFDDPVTSMEYLAKWYNTIKQEVQQNDPQTWQRYLNLAAAPRGISCEFCCGIGAQGITKDGNLRCGCKHNPAAQAIALGLMKNTDYSDAEILREVMKWKIMFFPKNMVGLAMDVAGTDPSQLKDLPGMVGGC